MKKWEDQNKAKLQQKKQPSTKPALPKLNQRTSNDSKATEMRKTFGTGNFVHSVNSPQQTNQSYNSRSPGSGYSDFFDFESIDFDEVPIYKLLKHYGLQQYARVGLNDEIIVTKCKTRRLSHVIMDTTWESSLDSQIKSWTR